MYRKHFGSIPVDFAGESRPLDIASTLNESGDTLIVSVVNATWDTQTFKMDLLGGKITGKVVTYSLVGDDDMAFNTPGEEMNVIISGPEIINVQSHFNIEPFSATIYKLPIVKLDL